MGAKANKALIFLLCCLLASCVKDKPGDNTALLPDATGNVYVVCEGAFGFGNSSLYAWQSPTDSIYGDLYQAANKQPLGDVFQSMQRIGDKLFLCINNSDKVVVINAANWSAIATINIPKPRYILPVSATKAYVSTLYSNKVYIINPQTYAVTGTIQLPRMNPEGMCRYNDAAFICTWDTASNNIYKVDVNTDQVIQEIKVGGYAPQAALLDKDQMLWVLSGNQQKGKTAALSYIDPSTGSLIRSYQFCADADALKPAFNAKKDTLYFIEVNYNGGIANNGIYRMAIQETNLPATPFLAAQQYQYFWALGIDAGTNDIYVGDPKGFVQKGVVDVYRPDGQKARSFKTGVGPGQFYFDK
jgi:YVTN family beta-propeller protein